MATKTIKFTPVPGLPTSNIDSYQLALLTALKDNVEAMIGVSSGNPDARAVFKGSITNNQLTSPNFDGVTATGSGYVVSGVKVPSSDDYQKLIRDVAKLAADVKNLTSVVNILIKQLAT